MTATYRLQLTPNFDLFDATAFIPTLQTLGISHLYLSPIFAARPGSTHGYDVTDPTRIRRELGGDDGFRALTDAVRAADMRVLLDIVPNHMAAHATTPWWWDVLKHGRQSRFADVFDIHWDENAGRVVLPVLSRSPNDVVGAGQLTIDRGSPHDSDEPVLRYFDHLFPLAPHTPRPTTSRSDLNNLLAAQHYELAFWRDGLQRVNYRRFFDISELVAVRVEDDTVFDRTHHRLLELVADDVIAGVRLDHIDGLHDPTGYLRRLRRELDARRIGMPPCAIYVEKILMGDEPLPPDWPIDGTTGYEFTNDSAHMLVDSDGCRTIESDAMQRGACTGRFTDAVFDAKVQVQHDLFKSELDRLTRLFLEAAVECNAPSIGFESARRAILALTAALDVYRTYADARGIPAGDRQRLEHAITRARNAIPADDGDAMRALHSLRALVLDGLTENRVDDAALSFVSAWQQVTGAVMAKGCEDTALYRYIALSSLNEVGGEPMLPADAVTAFQDANQHRAWHLPNTMNATATHDSKRGEDTRARINVLSEVPEQWTAALDRWMHWHTPLRRIINDATAPSPGDEILFYQSLLGIMPPCSQIDDIGNKLMTRLQDYAVKAAREAKLHTDWYTPNAPYEQALRDFIESVLIGDDGARFRKDIADLAAVISFHGAINSLAQLVLKAASPGVPDFYQGTERWDLTLVDPDNRRPIDSSALHNALQSLPIGADQLATSEQCRSMRDSWIDGRIKLYFMIRALAARRLFNSTDKHAEYHPIVASGNNSAHVVAFARRTKNRWLLAIAPRLTVSLVSAQHTWPIGADVWADTTLPLPTHAPLRWTDQLSIRSIQCVDHTLRLAELLNLVPFGLLTAERTSDS